MIYCFFKCCDYGAEQWHSFEIIRILVKYFVFWEEGGCFLDRFEFLNLMVALQPAAVLVATAARKNLYVRVTFHLGSKGWEQ